MWHAGSYNCAGKMLALMELRMVIVELVNSFDIVFAPGEDGSGVKEAADNFTLCPGPLKLMFIPRRMQ